MPQLSEHSVSRLRQSFAGQIRTDETSRKIYATDASVYQQTPALIAIPETAADVRRLIRFANEHRIGLIPRAAGTSLAGQVVGDGIVVDVSRLNRILEINATEKYVVVQPGVIRDELNLALVEHEMFFAPETSTSNRAMIGGMLGNNSCGANSIVYGTTRENTIEVSGFLSDGSEVSFGPLSKAEFEFRCKGAGLEADIYRGVRDIFGPAETRRLIRENFPKPEIHRRNTGYALDRLMESNAFEPNEQPFNFCNLIAGSEGTLVFATEIKLRCQPLPPAFSALVCAHFESLDAAARATQIAMRHAPRTCELMDTFILEGAMRNLDQRENCRFVEGQPTAILAIGLAADDKIAVQEKAARLVEELQSAGLGYAFPVLTGEDAARVWAVRKAGLGIVNNVPGDEKPVTVVEDPAVTVDDLPAFMTAVNDLLQTKYGIDCVNYGHAGAGEIHFRPIFNMKTTEGIRRFRNIAADVAGIVKTFRGSLSGEHGDGRLRSEFLELMVGAEVYRLFQTIKQSFDPADIFNPGKIVGAPSMTADLRFQPDQKTPQLKTVFSFDHSQGIVRAAELCNGAGVCRKTHLSGGTMCPSYMATRNESDTTRARANLLRQSLTDPKNSLRPYDSPETRAILDLCLSCKGCKAECPSNVDMARLKAEFTNGQHDLFGVPLRTRMTASIELMNSIASRTPGLANWMARGWTGKMLKRLAGFHPLRSMPRLEHLTLRKWFAAHTPHQNAGGQGSVNFFCDEFTNYFDVKVGIAAIELLERLGWTVKLPDHLESGRVAVSVGMLHRAKKIAVRNVELLSGVVSDESPLVGVEPSTLLTLRDEYPDLMDSGLRDAATELARNAFLLEEFLMHDSRVDAIDRSLFRDDARTIRLHGHCHQKALSSLAPTVRMLQLPKNYFVKLIPSGCCGMAGSFGYDAGHYDLSMQIGELVLFPAVRKSGADELIAAPGTSCRHQILDGTGRIAMHPAEILRDAIAN